MNIGIRRSSERKENKFIISEVETRMMFSSEQTVRGRVMSGY